MLNRYQALTELASGIQRLAAQREQQEKSKRMNSRDFMYWLQGYLELSDTTGITASKVATIRRHLTLAIQTEADGKHLDDEHTRARIRKMHAEADTMNGQQSGYRYPSSPAGC